MNVPWLHSLPSHVKIHANILNGLPGVNGRSMMSILIMSPFLVLTVSTIKGKKLNWKRYFRQIIWHLGHFNDSYDLLTYVFSYPTGTFPWFQARNDIGSMSTGNHYCFRVFETKESFANVDKFIQQALVVAKDSLIFIYIVSVRAKRTKKSVVEI